MSAPIVLDAYCGDGGAAMGYLRAGFRVIGVDRKDHSQNYPGEFHQGDAVEFIRRHGRFVTLIHTSPPCQGQIRITKGNRARAGWRDNHVNLIPKTRAACEEAGRPYVIENGPSEHLRSDLLLCGLQFGLPIFRDRAFELGGWDFDGRPYHPSHRRAGLTIGWRHGCLRTPAASPEICPLHDKWCEGKILGVYGRGGRKPTVPEARHALGIDWTEDPDALNEAIPPAYTQFVGRKFLDQTRKTA